MFSRRNEENTMSNAAVPKPSRKSRPKGKVSAARNHRFLPTVEERIEAARKLRQFRLPVGPVEQMKKESVPEPKDLPR